jgi:hypothetical protein
MPPITLDRLCTILTQVEEATASDLGEKSNPNISSSGPGEWCRQLKMSGVTDIVDVTPREVEGDVLLQVNQQGVGRNWQGIFRMAGAGSVYTGIGNVQPLLFLRMEWALMLTEGLKKYFGQEGLGIRWMSYVRNRDARTESAMQYFDCLLAERACTAERTAVLERSVPQRAAEAKQRALAAMTATQRKEQARQDTISSAFDGAIGIWKRMDQFLVAGKLADASDSDYDILERVVLRHAGARPTLRPMHIPDAQRILASAEAMLGEFRANEAYEGFMTDEGACTWAFRNRQECSYGTGTYGERQQTCALGGMTYLSPWDAYDSCTTNDDDPLDGFSGRDYVN